MAAIALIAGSAGPARAQAPSSDGDTGDAPLVRRGGQRGDSKGARDQWPRITVGGSLRWRTEDLQWDDEQGKTATATAAGHVSPVIYRQSRTLLARTRLFASVEWTSGLASMVELQHTRTWSNNTAGIPEDDHLDLRQAWVEWRPAGTPAWALRVGRFTVPEYGDGRLFSSNDWTNLSPGLDGISAAWVGDDWDVWLLTANTNRSDPLPWKLGAGDDHWIGGGAVEWRGLPSLEADFYTFGRWFDGSHSDVTLGTRLAWKVGGFTLAGEVYGQLGRHDTDTVSAWASVERFDWIVVPTIPLQPTIFLEHTFASGDKRPGDRRLNTFDPLFNDVHRHLGPFDALSWRNNNGLATGLAFDVGGLVGRRTGWMFNFVARGSFVASGRDAWYGADGTAILFDVEQEASSRTLEGELSGWIEGPLLDEQMTVSLGLAHWCPNNFLGDLHAHQHGYRFWASVEYRF